MGFLDRIVADMIGDATGLPVKGLVRKVGAKNLLLLGGVAAAGGVAAHQIAQKRAQPQPGGAPPAPPPQPAPGQTSSTASLPPIPTGSIPPPPPPPATPRQRAAAEKEDLPPDLVFAIVRTMVAAALADGHMSPEEKQTIHTRLGESGLDQDRIRQIHQDLVIPASPDELAAMIPDPAQRPALYRSAILVLLADRQVQPTERAWLDRLAAALGFDGSVRSELEKDLLG